MANQITPLLRQTLSDNLAQALNNYIVSNGYLPGQKIPSISKLAQQFRVGIPTLREAIKKLETIGAIKVKHGSGIYVGNYVQSFFLKNPIVSEEVPTKKQLLDLINARLLIEQATAALAAENASEAQLGTMENLLREAEANLEKDDVLNQKNMSFHHAIAVSSGNMVFSQILEVITHFFKVEQRIIIDIFRGKEADHQQHVEIFKAIRDRDQQKSAKLMICHLEGVRKSIIDWHPIEEAVEKINHR
jgi:GntR family transcriptional repressor for pyruvate dehydrogenase complex